MTTLFGLHAAAFAVGTLGLLVAAALIAYGVWELWRSATPAPAGPPVGPPSGLPASTPTPAPLSALAVLDDRLARGDIDPDDYARRRSLLLGEVPAGSQAGNV